MKIADYNSMMSHLTKPDNRPPEVKKAEAEKREAAEIKRKNEKRKEYGIGNIEEIAKKYDDETSPEVEKRGQQTVALTNTANKHLNNQIKKGTVNKDDYILKEDKNGLMVNKNRTIAIRDSFMAKQFNNALGVEDEPKATPEQVGKLAERLERNAQMTGGKGPFTKIKKPITKKKFTTTPYTFKIDPMPYYPEPIKRDPYTEALGRKIQEDKLRSDAEKLRERNSGLAGLIGGFKKYD